MTRRRTIEIATTCRLVGRRRKTGLLCAAAVAVAVAASSSRTAGQEFEWLLQFPGGATALTADGAGGVFLAGATSIRRHDGAGSLLWNRELTVSSSGSPVAGAITEDGAGGAMIAGHTYRVAGDDDIWLARYGSDGSRKWVTEFGSSEYDALHAAASDGLGGAFVGGYTVGDLAPPYTGLAWLARYDGDGQRVWARQLGEDYQSVLGLTSDGAGGCFAAGFTIGRHAWLARYDKDGEQMWAKSIASGWDEAWAVAPDGAGGVFVAGFTTGALGGSPLGRGDAWLARYSGAGDLVWIAQMGTTELDYAAAVASDGAGGAFVAGYTKPPDPSPAGDIWVASYDEVGAERWTMRFGTPEFDSARALAASPSGGVFVAGATAGELVPGGSGTGWLGRIVDSCYADCDASGTLDFFDFLCFQNLFAAGDPQADCDGDTQLTFFDFLCFQNAFAAGCP